MARTINPNTQYEKDGKPIVGGKVYYGVANQDPILNPIPIFSDSGLTVPIANPQLLDSQGFLANRVFVGVNQYSFQVDDNLDSQQLADPLLEPLNIVGLVTANIDLNGFKIVNAADGTANTDYATFGQNNALYAQVLDADASSTIDAIVAIFPVSPTSLVNGQRVIVRLSDGFGANATTTPTFKLNLFTPATMTRDNNDALLISDTSGDRYYLDLTYNLPDNTWHFSNPFNIKTVQIPDDTITTDTINDLAVTTPKIAALAVTEGKVGALAVTEGKIGALAVTSGKIGALAVTTPKIANNAVDNTKSADMAQATIKGTPTTGGTQDPVDLTPAEARLTLGLGDLAVKDEILAADVTQPTADTTFIIKRLADNNELSTSSTSYSANKYIMGASTERAFGTTCLIGGVIKITFDQRIVGAGSSFVQIVKNGVQQTEITESSNSFVSKDFDLAVGPGDHIFIGQRSSGLSNSEIRNIFIKSGVQTFSCT